MCIFFCILIIVIIFCVSIFGGYYREKSTNISNFEDYEAVLYVNSIYLIKNNVTLFANEKTEEEIITLPFVAFLNSVGMRAEWVSENEAFIYGGNKKYIMNISDIALYEEGSNENLFAYVDGGYSVYNTLEKEIVVDSASATCTLLQMGIKVRFSIDKTEKIIYANVEKIGQ